MMYVKIFVLMVIATMLYSCDDSEMPENGELILNLNFTTELDMGQNATVKINLVSSEGITSTYEVPLQSQAIIRVSSGVYNITANVKYASNNVIHLFSGQLSDVVLRSDDSVSCDMQMNYSQSGQIVISEIYYSGCVGASGSTYYNDQYLILHNNSADTAYLDKLCLGFVFPLRASSKSFFVDYYTDRTVVANFLWQFPGDGSDYPIAPGSDVVVAPNCVNHIALGNTESVDLSKEGYWACYDVNANLTKQSPPATPDKKLLKLLWRNGTSTSCVCSIFDPAFVLFGIQGDELTYLKEYDTTNPSMPSSSTHYMGVPYSWIYDGVECFDATNRYKRLSGVVDGGYSLMTKGSAAGTSVRRKLNVEASTKMGFSVYQDTNNSSEDFEPCYPPSLKNLK